MVTSAVLFALLAVLCFMYMLNLFLRGKSKEQQRPERADARSRKAGRQARQILAAPVRMAYNYGFSQTELNRIAALVQEHEAALSKAWHEYFKRRNGDGGGQERSRH